MDGASWEELLKGVAVVHVLKLFSNLVRDQKVLALRLTTLCFCSLRQIRKISVYLVKGYTLPRLDFGRGRLFIRIVASTLVSSTYLGVKRNLLPRYVQTVLAYSKQSTESGGISLI
jgi:hypothetical protein